MFVCTNHLPRARWFNQIGSCITEQLIQAHHQYGVGWRPATELYYRNKTKGVCIIERNPHHLPCAGRSLIFIFIFTWCNYIRYRKVIEIDLECIQNGLRDVGGFLLVLRFPPPIKLTATI
jgi:hypothetical protein